MKMFVFLPRVNRTREPSAVISVPIPTLTGPVQKHSFERPQNTVSQNVRDSVFVRWVVRKHSQVEVQRSRPLQAT